MKNDRLRRELYESILSMKKINTHCHHMSHTFYPEIGLQEIFQSSYVGWCHHPCRTREERARLFDAVRDRSYYIWLEKSLREIYGLEEPLNEDNWDAVDALVREADRADRSFTRLRTLCGYEHVIQDCYWNYGDDLGDSELFTPTFRINIFLNGFDREGVDRDGCSITKYIPEPIRDADEYVAAMAAVIAEKQRKGCVALKCASAYERGLDFYPVTKERADVALQRPLSELTPGNIADFQSYIFYKLCDIAAARGLPFQVHTGLGQIENTRALCLAKAIKDHPSTRFVLFHLSFPYIDDVIALAHNFENVYPDICWVPLLSYNTAVDAISRLLDTVNSDKLCWGCDTWTAEESYGAVLAMAHVLSVALTQRVSEGFMTPERAKEICRRILYENAKKLYQL